MANTSVPMTAGRHEVTFGLLLLFGLFAVFLAGAVSLDPRIVSIKGSDGSVTENPNAFYMVHITTDYGTYEQLKKVCESFCAPQTKSFYSERKIYHDWTYSHFDRRNYLYSWENSSANGLMAYDLRMSAQYKKLSDGCKLCSNLGKYAPNAG
jgi:hypothetical protein